MSGSVATNAYRFVGIYRRYLPHSSAILLFANWQFPSSESSQINDVSFNIGFVRAYFELSKAQSGETAVATGYALGLEHVVWFLAGYAIFRVVTSLVCFDVYRRDVERKLRTNLYLKAFSRYYIVLLPSVAFYFFWDLETALMLSGSGFPAKFNYFLAQFPAVFFPYKAAWILGYMTAFPELLLYAILKARERAKVE